MPIVVYGGIKEKQVTLKILYSLPDLHLLDGLEMH